MSVRGLEEYRSILKARREYLLVWTALLVWDTLATLRLEREAIWKAKRTPMKILFLMNRYGSLILCLASCVIFLHPMSDGACAKLYWVQPFEIVYIVLICHSILGIRLYAIFERSQIVKYCLIVGIMTEAALAIAGVSYFEPMDLPRPVANYIGLEGCLTARKDGSPNLAIALNVSPAVFDTCVLLAVVWKNWITTRRIGQQVPILERLLFDGIVYYIFITATHLATMLMYFSSHLSLRTFNVPASVVLISLSCSRLVMSLQNRSNTRPALRNLPSVAQWL